MLAMNLPGGMNWFDYLLLAILIYSTIEAFVTGLMRELFSLGGLIAGLFLAAWNYQRLAAGLSGIITNKAAAEVTAFLFIAIGIMVLSAFAGRLLSSTAKAVGLKFFDRLGGAAFGVLRGGLIGVVILMAVSAFLPKAEWAKNSRLAPYFLAGAHEVSFVVPRDLEQRIRDGAEEIKHKAPGWIKLHR